MLGSLALCPSASCGCLSLTSLVCHTMQTLIPPDSPSLPGTLQPPHHRPVCRSALSSQLGYTVTLSELGTHWPFCPPGACTARDLLVLRPWPQQAGYLGHKLASSFSEQGVQGTPHLSPPTLSISWGQLLCSILQPCGKCEYCPSQRGEWRLERGLS